MTFGEFHSKLKTLKLDQLMRETIKDNDKVLITVNRSQLRGGFDAEGKQLKQYRSIRYAKAKQKLSSYKAPFRIPDLYLTGSFQNNMNLRVSGSEWDISSSDNKAEGLYRKYGEIFGIAEQNLPTVQRIMTPRLGAKIKMQLGL